MNRQHGFTLIEVLVASFILFLVIASVTLVYRGAVLSSIKAERVVVISSQIKPIKSLVKDEITRANGQLVLDGSGEQGDVTYTWQAQVIKQGRAPARFDPETARMSEGKLTIYYWEINMSLSFKDNVRHYQFNEVTW